MPAPLSTGRISLFIVDALAYTQGRWMPRLRWAAYQAGMSDGVDAPGSTSSASALFSENKATDRCWAFGNEATMKAKLGWSPMLPSTYAAYAAAPGGNWSFVMVSYIIIP